MTDRHVQMETAIFIAKALFNRGKAAGSAANMSFREGDEMVITASGTCFGTLDMNSFAAMPLSGQEPKDSNPSKEWPLHMQLYAKDPLIKAVIHVHSPYATLWSCLCGPCQNTLPAYTPYLAMRLGDVGYVPYHPPGSQALFDAFHQVLDARNGYLLAHHGPIVAAASLMDAFYALEELEESARLAYLLRHENVPTIT